MKISQYNISKELADQNRIIVFNTFTTSLVTIEKDLYEKIFVEHDFNQSVVSDLMEMGFIVESDRDEYRAVIEIRKRLMSENSGLTSATILLTTACNARCYYCFEKGIKPYTVTFELCDQIVEFLYKNSNKEKIFISWFGGEPLMAFDKLKYINDKLKEKGLKVTSKITTNGSLITDEVVTYAKENNINVFQVTVDDIGEKYNNIKNYVSLKNGYRVVVDNIKKLLNAGITVSIRINHKSEEFEYAKTVLENLKETLGDRENLHIYLAALTLHNQKLFAESKENHPYLKLLRYSVVTDNKIRNWKNNAVYEKNDDLLSQYFLNPIGLSCGMEMDDKIIINADGKLYKCHRLAGREGHSCGDVYSGVNKESAEYLRFSDSEIREDKCKTCSLLPLCHGGCKANKVLYPECDNCIVIKNFIGELILTYYNDIQSCNK